MGEEVNILNIIKSLKKRLNLILSVTFLSIATVWLLLVFVIAPDFQATTQIWMEEPAAETPEEEVSSNKADPVLINAYGQLLKSRDVLDLTIKELNLEYSIHELNELITVTHATNTQVLNITVSSSDSREAVEIANALTSILQEMLMEWLGMDNVTIIAKASEETVVSSLDENLIFGLGLAGAFGLIVGVLIAFIIEMLNISLKNNNRGLRRKRRKKDEEATLQTVFK
ncbi:YveK family protein [Planomicrobium sp. CPCC 101079]|uniref:YveK family protein n=1 Tax=Planomicrobium sp. CPCC 101079 TaxID=2599618 RepID=UPI001648A574|nr:Wzz/FepE/Etk N-terminal domain-containing protein [Planomicrobium sp. CPCC 101079]